MKRYPTFGRIVASPKLEPRYDGGYRNIHLSTRTPGKGQDLVGPLTVQAQKLGGPLGYSRTGTAPPWALPPFFPYAGSEECQTAFPVQFRPYVPHGVMSSCLLCTLTQRCPIPPPTATLTLALTADQRQRSRLRLPTPQGDVLLHLPRGTHLTPGDYLQDDAGTHWVAITAAIEPVYWVTASTALDLLRGAYHLGNRHVPLELTLEGLRLERDPVLRDLLERLGLTVTETHSPFQPEAGAYHGDASHTHHHHS